MKFLVALASSNVQLVAMKVISRLCRVIEKTCTSPTSTLEQHLMWDDIAILARYLLMLSFNNCLDVASHLPYLFHIVTLLVHTGPMSLRASIHGLVINIIHSLCTCTKPSFNGETQRLLRLSLDEFSLPKFYLLFGISKVKSAAVTAFRSTNFTGNYGRHFCPERHHYLSHERSFNASIGEHQERMPLASLEIITDALLEIMEACMKNIPNCDWLQQWTESSKSFAFRYNPAIQPRAIIVFGCITKITTDQEVKQLLRILVKALESFQDLQLIEAIIMGLTRLQPLLAPESPIHRALFWVSISVLQLDEMTLYASGLALLEQNLHTLDSQGIFENNTLKNIMMQTREPLEWHFKQLDHSVGLSFKSNFHCAFVGHLIKGFRHPTPTTVSRTARILNMLLCIIAKPHKRDKFEVTSESAPYLSALVSVSEEVQSRCHLKHRVTRLVSESPSSKNFSVEPSSIHHQTVHATSSTQTTGSSTSPKNPPTTPTQQTPSPTPLPSPSTSMASSVTQSTIASSFTMHQLHPQPASNVPVVSNPNTPCNKRQKSWDLLDQNAISQAKLGKIQSSLLSQQVQQALNQNAKDPAKHWKSLDIDAVNTSKPIFRTQRSSSMPTPRAQKSGENSSSDGSVVGIADASGQSTRGRGSPEESTIAVDELEENRNKNRHSRVSVSNEDNVLLDSEVLTDFPNQALVLTILVS